jgi:hypothetical protein
LLYRKKEKSSGVTEKKSEAGEHCTPARRVAVKPLVSPISPLRESLLPPAQAAAAKRFVPLSPLSPMREGDRSLRPPSAQSTSFSDSGLHSSLINTSLDNVELVPLSPISPSELEPREERTGVSRTYTKRWEGSVTSRLSCTNREGYGRSRTVQGCRRGPY